MYRKPFTNKTTSQKLLEFFKCYKMKLIVNTFQFLLKDNFIFCQKHVGPDLTLTFIICRGLCVIIIELFVYKILLKYIFRYFHLIYQLQSCYTPN